MSTNTRNRRWAVAGAVAVTLIGLANAPAAEADTDLDPFQDLLGDTGINTWTPAADSYLASIDPTNALAVNLDTSVDNFVMGELVQPGDFFGQFDVISLQAYASDTSAFSFENGILTPLTPAADLALGLDYSLFATGLAPTVEPLITELYNAQGAPEALLFSVFFWGAALLESWLSGVGM
jgi:hypothetical protein